MQGKYPVITLCGSTRFKDQFMEMQKKLTLEGNIVISVGLFGHSGDSEVWENMDEGTLTKTKEMLDDIHKLWPMARRSGILRRWPECDSNVIKLLLILFLLRSLLSILKGETI